MERLGRLDAISVMRTGDVDVVVFTSGPRV